MLFFQDANQRKTIFNLLFLASVINCLIREKSNLPSSLSIISQYTGTKTVLRFKAFNFGQIGCIYCMDVAEEFPNSPPRMIYGLPATINCVVLPFFLRKGI